MLRRQIRVWRGLTIANDVNQVNISSLFDCKNTDSRRVLKKYTQAPENTRDGGTEVKSLSYKQLGNKQKRKLKNNVSL